MTTLLVAKQMLMTIYSKYEVYITPLLKFLLSLITLCLINSRLGYMDTLNRMTVVLIVALMCSFMPMNFIVLMGAVFVLLHLYTFSMECAAVIGAGFCYSFCCTCGFHLRIPSWWCYCRSVFFCGYPM